MDLSSVFKDRKFNQDENKGGNSPPFIVTKQNREFSFDNDKKRFVEVESKLPKLPRIAGAYPNYSIDDEEDTPHWSMLYGYNEQDPRTVSANELKKPFSKLNDNKIVDWEDEMYIVDTYKEGQEYVDRYGNTFKVDSNDYRTVGIIVNPHMNKLNHPVIRLSRVDFLVRVNFTAATE